MRHPIWGYLFMLLLGGVASWAYFSGPFTPRSLATLPPVRVMSLPAGTTQIADLVERAAPAVVNIDTVSQRAQILVDPFAEFFGASPQTQIYVQKGVGSGFIIGSDGLIVTNNHVVRHASRLTVTLNDGRVFTGHILGRDPAMDVAVVQIDAHHLPTLPLGSSHNLRVGEWVVAIGSPLGLSKTVTAGIVSALNRAVDIDERVSFIQTDAAINPGNSGGPLIDMNDQVIGMNTAIAAKAQGIGFAIPSDTVRNIVTQLETNGKVEQPWIGVSISDLTPERAQQMFYKSDPGVIVRQVIPHGPADRAGIKAGDVLLQVDGQKLERATELIRYLASKRVGDKITLLVNRQGQLQTMHLTLASMPESLQAPLADEGNDQGP